MENNEAPEVFSSLTQAAKYMNTERQGVFAAIKKGRLKSTIVNGRHQISRKDIDEYLDNKYDPRERKFQGQKVYNQDEGDRSVEQVALWLSEKLKKPCTSNHIYYLLYTGRVRAFKKGGSWVIKKEDYEALYEQKVAGKKRQMTFA